MDTPNAKPGHSGTGAAFIQRPNILVEADAYVSAWYAYASPVTTERIYLTLGRDLFRAPKSVALEMDPETAVHIIGALTFALKTRDEYTANQQPSEVRQ